VTGPGKGVDVASASADAYGPGLPDLFRKWGQFRAWAANVTFEAPEVTFTPEELGPPSPCDYLEFILQYATAQNQAGQTPAEAYADIDLAAFASWQHSSRAFLNIYAVHRELDPHTYTVAPAAVARSRSCRRRR
jgi:hypothetical protein